MPSVYAQTNTNRPDMNNSSVSTSSARTAKPILEMSKNNEKRDTL